jgi:hypothetical protein
LAQKLSLLNTPYPNRKNPLKPQKNSLQSKNTNQSAQRDEGKKEGNKVQSML